MLGCTSANPSQVMRESLAKLESLCLGSTSKDQDWTSAVEDTRYGGPKLCKWFTSHRSALLAGGRCANTVHAWREVFMPPNLPVRHYLVLKILQHLTESCNRSSFVSRNIHVSIPFAVPLCVRSTGAIRAAGGRWLSHVRTVLSAAWTVAVKAHERKAPVLVHCSHGWDRTSQVGGWVGGHVGRIYVAVATLRRSEGSPVSPAFVEIRMIPSLANDARLPLSFFCLFRSAP